jgi:hypothetical protein
MNAADHKLFAGGPHSRLYGRLRVFGVDLGGVTRLAIVATAVAWLPLALLTAWHGDVFGAVLGGAFLRDMAVHARCLIAIPLLIVAQPACISTLGQLAMHFREAGLVTAADDAHFDAAIASTRRWRDARFAEIAVVLAAYALVAAALYSVGPQHLPAWQRRGGGATGFSAAGWWHALVSMPLLMVLLLGWLWRLFLWARLLWLVSRLNLKLLPAHPDRAAGLRFVGYSVNAQVPFAAALGVIAAGTIAIRVIADPGSLLSYKFVVAGLVAFAVIIVVAPLLAFTDKLLEAWQRGVLEYSELGNRSGREFERHWISDAGAFADSPLLHTQTATAASNMYTLASNVYAMRFIPVDSRSVLVLVVMTVLPFLPVVLIALPLDLVIKDLAKFLI